MGYSQSKGEQDHLYIFEYTEIKIKAFIREKKVQSEKYCNYNLVVTEYL